MHALEYVVWSTARCGWPTIRCDLKLAYAQTRPRTLISLERPNALIETICNDCILALRSTTETCFHVCLSSQQKHIIVNLIKRSSHSSSAPSNGEQRVVFYL